MNAIEYAKIHKEWKASEPKQPTFVYNDGDTAIELKLDSDGDVEIARIDTHIPRKAAEAIRDWLNLVYPPTVSRFNLVPGMWIEDAEGVCWNIKERPDGWVGVSIRSDTLGRVRYINHEGVWSSDPHMQTPPPVVKVLNIRPIKQLIIGANYLTQRGFKIGIERRESGSLDFDDYPLVGFPNKVPYSTLGYAMYDSSFNNLVGEVV